MKVLDTDSIDLNNSYQKSIYSESKRYFTTQDFTFHLMRKHFWPKMEIKKWTLDQKNKRQYVSDIINKITHVSKNNKNKLNQKNKLNNIEAISFSGYKNNKMTGPGVVYYVRENRQIDTYIGFYCDDILDKEATIIRNGKMIYDGDIVKGVKDGFGIQRCYFEIDKNLSLIHI